MNFWSVLLPLRYIHRAYYYDILNKKLVPNNVDIANFQSHRNYFLQHCVIFCEYLQISSIPAHGKGTIIHQASAVPVPSTPITAR